MSDIRGPSAFERALKQEIEGAHKDQHADVAKATLLWGPYYWCFACGWMPPDPDPLDAESKSTQ